MKHIEPIDKLSGTAYSTNSDYRLYEKINEIVEVLNSLTEKKIPVECEEEKKIPHAHCKCMNLDGQCPNYHFATCPICKPEKTAESELREEYFRAYSSFKNVDEQANWWIKKLASHTEQKKKELIEKIHKLPQYGDTWTGTIVRLKGVLHLIKEL